MTASKQGNSLEKSIKANYINKDKSFLETFSKFLDGVLSYSESEKNLPQKNNFVGYGSSFYRTFI